MKHLIYPAALILAATALTGCLTGNSSGTGNGGLGEQFRISDYSVAGNKIIMPGSNDTEYYCMGNALQTQIDTGEADTVEFVISGATLTVYTHPYTRQSGAEIQRYTLLQRVGSGSGLEGTWSSADVGYRVLSGTLTAEDKSELDANFAENSRRNSLLKFSLQFVNGKMITFVDADVAALFVEEWNDESFSNELPDSARYDISVKAVDRSTVELKGRKSGETVRITGAFMGDEIYTSDLPAHAKYTHFRIPKSCPNDDVPDWYEEFRSANQKVPSVLEKSGGLGKKSGEMRPKNGFRPHFDFFPLKPSESLLN
jgi:hypothetical protein